MSRFKVKNKSEIKVGESCLDLRKYLKNKQLIKIDDEYYYPPRMVKSESGEHTFEIYDQIEDKYNQYLKNQEINKKLDDIISILKSRFKKEHLK